jgi:branched-chain amino acid transport system substrate-binding protein
MRDLARRRRPRRGPRAAAALAVLPLLLLAAGACGGDDGGEAGSEAGSGDQDEGVGADRAADLLGPEDPASGEPVRIGMVSDGATDAFDNRDELRAARATAEFWNTHRGGVGGRPVEVVTCETGSDPAGATDCANQFVEAEVVAVALSQSAVGEQIWEPLHAAGVPTMWFQASGEAIATDEETSFVITDPTSTLFGLPMAVAESEGTDRIAFVVIDVPQALSVLEEVGPSVFDEAGLEYDVVPIAPGTADMTSQMQEVVNSDAGVVHVTGNDAFCIAAFDGLTAVGYEGEIASISQCITDATRESVPGDVLEGINVTATLALGATDDPTYQLYQAVMSTFGENIADIDNNIAMGGYVAMASLLTSLQEISGDVTPETVVETIKSMPEQELPGGGGMTFQCGGSAVPGSPAVCTDQSLRTQLDAEGEPTTYEVVDTSDAGSG